uniref:Polymerase nucleotidyl transferase domain-containing protein n=1 Tax=Leersia perrieri TaxID=77586 RepID=A0A0D9WT28_9ORYZ
MASAASPRTARQLTDALTAHLSLYHAAANPNPSSSSTSSSPRAAILRWLASLAAPARAAAAASLLSPAAAGAFISMLRRLRLRGHSSFFVLHPSSAAADGEPPTVLSRVSRGLLARAAEASRGHGVVFESLVLFPSSPASSSRLDAITVAEALLADLDGFVAAMDEISGGEFLRCGDGEVDLVAMAGEEFPELPWLKAKGYYVIEEFVANWVEIALRMSWAAAVGSGGGGGGGGRKAVRVGKGVKEKAYLAANAYWREKGYVDWWMRLEPRVRARIMGAFFAKGTAALANEIIEGTEIASSDKFSFCLGERGLFVAETSYKSTRQSFFRKNRPCSLDIPSILSGKKNPIFVKELQRLMLIQEILSFKINISNLSGDAIFFTTLMSAGTVADHVLLKLRGILMVVSTESINLELIGDGEPKTAKKKDVDKVSGGSRKGKKKSSSSKKLTASCKQIKDIGCSSSDSHDPKVLPNQQNPSVVGTTIGHASEDNPCKETAPTPKMEQPVVLGDCKNQCINNKRNRRKGKTKLSNLMRAENPGSGTLKTDAPPIATEAPNKPVDATHVPPHLPLSVKSKSCIPKADADSSIAHNGTDAKGIVNKKLENILNPPRFGSLLTTECSQSVNTSDGCSMKEQVVSHISQNEPTLQPLSSLPSRSDTVDRKSVVATDKILPPVIPANMFHGAISDNGAVMKNGGGEYYVYNRNTLGGTSYEWPSVRPPHYVSPEMQRPATTDRLHLDVGYKWPTQFEQPFLPANHQMRNPPVEQMLSSLAVPLSFDWPPVFRGYGKLSQNNALGYDPLYTPQIQSSAWSGFHTPLIHRGNIFSEKDRKYFSDSDPRNKPDVGDDTESYWFSEEESDGRAHSGRDINQYFGGGVMYWSPAEHAGTGFSRPPSLSSDDSAWAWHEADVSQVVDDIPIGIPCTYNANGVSSPPSTSICSPNESPDPLPQSIGHSMTANGMNSVSLQSPSSIQDSPEDKTISVSKSVSCGSEVIKGDTLPYAMLRPIVVPNISQRSSRSDIKGGHDHRSPCVPSTRRDIPLVRRPPSPVVLSVPRVPRPPPPSPVGESRKRGFPIVRSGSSSPRHWGMRNLFTEDKILNRAQLCLDGPEVVWPSWGNKGSSAGTLVQSIEDTVLQGHLVKISQLSRDQHPDVALPLQPPDMLSCSPNKASLSLMHNALHEEIDQFCKQVAAGNLVRKPYINWAVKRVTRCLQDLWPRSRTNLFGSNATGLALPTSDVDLVISLPPVRNLEPIKEAGILEGRNGIKETCLQHAARCLANQEWVRTDSLKTVENTAIPVIMLVAQVPCDTNLSIEYSSVLDSSQEQLAINVLGEQGSPPRSDNSSSEGSSMPMCSRINKDDGNVVQSIRLDISFKSSSHTGLQTTELVRELTQQFPAAVPLALILKKFLADRSLDHPYSGGLSSYCLVLLIIRFLQHEHHLGRPINQNLGSLLMDFLYFFGNVFDPRHMRISIQGSGIYLNRERGHSIDPIHIDDPLCPANNVGRNCFRIHQCIKAFADAFTVLENELLQFTAECDTPASSFNLLKKIMPTGGALN